MHGLGGTRHLVARLSAGILRRPHPRRRPGIGDHSRPRLRRLLAWLDYAVDLGCSGLLLGPIFASATHGYDSLDQFRIDPRLGDESDFADLVDACRARRLRIVLDGVFSHVSDRHPALLRALREGPDGAAAALFDIDWEHPGAPAPRVFEDMTRSRG